MNFMVNEYYSRFPEMTRLIQIRNIGEEQSYLGLGYTVFEIVQVLNSKIITLIFLLKLPIV